MFHQSENSLQLPIFDISQPLKSSSFASLATTCKEWGFFQIINHGISKDLCSKIHRLSNKIFSLPSEDKLKVGPFSPANTYTPHFIASPFFETIRVTGPDFAASAQSSADVSQILNSATVNYFKIMAVNHCHGYLRINNYTPPEKMEEEAEGLGMHTDMGCLTIVYQDEIGGLQVRSEDGKWMNITLSEGTLVVNIGDMLQAWSNERLRSSKHRVMLQKPVNRFSLAFFWRFEDEKVILAPDEVVGHEHTRTYKPFVCAEYVKFRESNYKKVDVTVKDFAGIEC